MQRRFALAALAALAAIAVFSVMPPQPRGASAPLTDFSAARAFAHVEQAGKTMHVAGSPANDAVREYLLTTLRGMGLNPEVQDAVGMHASETGQPFSAARVRNVVTVISGDRPTGRVFLTA